jgi:hypothetical protein
MCCMPVCTFISFFNHLCFVSNLSYFTVQEIPAKPSYNDIGLCDTSSVASDILWDQLIPHYEP